MKIAFFVNEFPSISETFIVNQLVGLIKRGHEIDIHAQQRRLEKEQHADVERYHLLSRCSFHSMPARRLVRLVSAAQRLSRWGWRDPKTTLHSLNIWRHGRAALNFSVLHELVPEPGIRKHYHVIHCHFGPNGNRAVTWRRFGALRGPIVTTFHGWDVNSLPRLYGPDMYEILFRDGDLFTVGSLFIKSRIEALGAPADRIIILPMGVDISRFRFVRRSKCATEELRLLTVARLVEVKGLEYGLRAVALLKKRYPHLSYQIAGDGPLRAGLELLRNDLGLSNTVEFLGALSQEAIIRLHQNAHIFILPSIQAESGEEEGQSVGLLEAQASGLPVIGTRAGGVPEIVRDGETGILVPPKDAEAIAQAVVRLAEHPEGWAEIGRLGRRHIEENFDIEKLNDQLVELYQVHLLNRQCRL
jgi:colanic acid/amylovoran biosynthesis glycosyltransferase